MILTHYPAHCPPVWANDPIEAEPMFRRVARPTTPPGLLDVGWALCSLPGGHWCCVHEASETETHIYSAAGPAIEEATAIEEPDHERIGKQNREWYLLTKKLGWRRRT